jgi:hypothetical protein
MQMCDSPWQRRVLYPVVAWTLAACANANTPPPEHAFQRIVVYTAREWPSTAPVSDRAKRLSGVPVSDVVELAPDRYRMSLQCPDADACRAAMTRIVADKTFAKGVDAEGRVQIPAKPTRDASR